MSPSGGLVSDRATSKQDADGQRSLRPALNIGSASRADTPRAGAGFAILIPPIKETPMNVQQLMTRAVRVAAPNDTLQQAAQMMEEDDFGLLPVADQDRLVGMLSDRDITIRAVARGLAPDQCMVAD